MERTASEEEKEGHRREEECQEELLTTEGGYEVPAAVVEALEAGAVSLAVM